MSRTRGGPARRATPGVSGGPRWGLIVVVGAVVVVFGAFAAVVFMDVRQQGGSTAPNGVTSFSNLSRAHTDKPVTYPQTPPVGGPHDPVWQNCGFYSKPVRNENAVHSLEHGAVWITYRPDLPGGQVETLRDLAHRQTYILVSPYPGLPSPVVASAWGKQLKLDSADDPRLEQFVSTYRQGPQTPEPGAACSGGVGSPG